MAPLNKVNLTQITTVLGFKNAFLGEISGFVKKNVGYKKLAHTLTRSCSNLFDVNSYFSFNLEEKKVWAGWGSPFLCAENIHFLLVYEF